MVQHIQDIHPELISDRMQTGDLSVEMDALAGEILALASLAHEEVRTLRLALVFDSALDTRQELDDIASDIFGIREGTSPEDHALIIEVARKLADKCGHLELTAGLIRGGK